MDFLCIIKPAISGLYNICIFYEKNVAWFWTGNCPYGI